MDEITFPTAKRNSCHSSGFNLEQIVDGDPEIWLETRGNCPSPWSAMQRLPGWTCQRRRHFSGYTDLLQKFMALKETGAVKVKSRHETIPLNYLGLKKSLFYPSTLPAADCLLPL
ncbi:hypothetical protein PO124_02925 [Bacillus licheniformis]|nr:hypothetical protein [Bacillus licheniformis]